MKKYSDIEEAADTLQKSLAAEGAARTAQAILMSVRLIAAMLNEKRGAY